MVDEFNEWDDVSETSLSMVPSCPRCRADMVERSGFISGKNRRHWACSEESCCGVIPYAVGVDKIKAQRAKVSREMLERREKVRGSDELGFLYFLD